MAARVRDLEVELRRKKQQHDAAHGQSMKHQQLRDGINASIASTTKQRASLARELERKQNVVIELKGAVESCRNKLERAANHSEALRNIVGVKERTVADKDDYLQYCRSQKWSAHQAHDASERTYTTVKRQASHATATHQRSVLHNVSK